MKASDCEPRGTKKDLAALNLAGDNHDYSAVVEIAEKLVAKGFVNMEAHVALSTAYGQMNQPAKGKYHLDVTTALIRSIFASGDGKSKERAFEVICDREVYVMMATLGLPAFGPLVSVMPFEDGAHRFESREVLDTKTGKTIKVFFNIDALSQAKAHAGIE
jgi:hypothetical protein